MSASQGGLYPASKTDSLLLMISLPPLLRHHLAVLLVFASGMVTSATVAAAGVGDSGLCISEFMARNLTTEVPGSVDGSFEDWIEIYNAGPASVNLDGWHLTDDPGIPFKWPFPAVDLAADGYLIVFASGEGLTRPNSDLHTNFRISSSGDYLALTDPQSKTVSTFPASGGTFPEQFADVSSHGISKPRLQARPTM
jgi:hypothetical protein